ncbi:MAG: DNA repair protein RadA [Actinomycetota bacterium]
MASKTKDKAGSGGHACLDCGYSAGKWFGRCPDCGSWNGTELSAAGEAVVNVTSLDPQPECAERFSSGIAEVDRVLGGGLVPGAVVLLAGEPGIGKSTLVLQLIDGVRRAGLKPLFVSGEESLAQVGMRARRLGVDTSALRAAATTSIPAIEAAVISEHPDLLVVDSVQTLEDPSLEQGAGSVSQVRDCTARLVRRAKETGVAMILVGHVTKDGNVAGPKTLEHVVDAVLTLDGDRTGALRLLRASKNRFGSCEETGVFTMEQEGLIPVVDPSGMLLEDRSTGSTGSVIFAAVEGTRTLLVELQSLLVDTSLPHPRRVASGIDPKRLAILLGVLSQRADHAVNDQDVFVAVSGGLDVREPAADLAIALAIASSSCDSPIDPGIIAFGEVGLGGEVRRVPSGARRLHEAARMGFTLALVPRGTATKDVGLRVREVRTLHEATEVIGLRPISLERRRAKQGEQSRVVSLGSERPA